MAAPVRRRPGGAGPRHSNQRRPPHHRRHSATGLRLGKQSRAAAALCAGSGKVARRSPARGDRPAQSGRLDRQCDRRAEGRRRKPRAAVSRRQRRVERSTSLVLRLAHSRGDTAIARRPAGGGGAGAPHRLRQRREPAAGARGGAAEGAGDSGGRRGVARPHPLARRARIGRLGGARHRRRRRAGRGHPPRAGNLRRRHRSADRRSVDRSARARVRRALVARRGAALRRAAVDPTQLALTVGRSCTTRPAARPAAAPGSGSAPRSRWPKSRCRSGSSSGLDCCCAAS